MFIRYVFSLVLIGTPLLSDYDPQNNADALNITIQQYGFLNGAIGGILGLILIYGLVRALK